jgi:hypothetical protein
MTEEANNNVQIQIEQICAAIIAKLGSVEVELNELITDYSKKSISVSQNEDTKAITFTLVDNAEVQAENE